MIDTGKLIQDYIKQNSWRIKENSNMTYSYPGMQGFVVGHVNSDYALNNIYSETIEKAHREAFIHVHDLSGLCNYCLGLDFEMFLFKGLHDEDGPPKHFSSALGQLANLIFDATQEIAGAIAFNSVDVLIAPYIKKDGLTYREVKQEVQSFVYNINEKSRLGKQSPFLNLQLDVTIPNRLKGRTCMIAGEVMPFTYDDCQDYAEWFNRAIFETLLEAKRLLPFPVLNIGITPEFDWDNKMAEVMFTTMGKLGQPRITNYVNGPNDPDAVKMMCCFDGSQPLMLKKYGYKPDVMSFEDAYSRFSGNQGIPVFHNGSWSKAKLVRYPGQGHQMYKVTLANKKELMMTENHINVTLEGLKATQNLGTGDYLVMNTIPCEAEFDRKTFAMGVLIGAYLGDGCRTEREVTLSMNPQKCTLLKPYLEQALNDIDAQREIHSYQNRSGETLRIYGSEVSDFIGEWVYGSTAPRKHMNLDILRTSMDFRKGVLFGISQTDGGDRNRIYTTSKKLISDIEAMLTTMGIISVIDEDDRVGQEVMFPDGHVTKKNFVLHCIRYYDARCKRKHGKIYKTINNQIGFRVEKIEKINTPEWVYCCEMVDREDPYFTLPNGVITHNCSIRLDMSELIPAVGGSFGAADNSGSTGVVTLNLPRYGYLAAGDKDILKEYIRMYMQIGADSLARKRRFIEEMHKMGMYPVLARFIEDFSHFFNTIGTIGLNEMCQNFFGSADKGIDSPEGYALSEEIILYVNDVLRELQKIYKDFYVTGKGLIFNHELTPAEGTTYRFAKHDKERHPDIIRANGHDNDFYTRGCWLPVNKDYHLNYAVKHQEKLQWLYTGGADFNIYLNEQIHDWRAVRSLVKKVVTHTKLPMLTVSPTVTVCPVCGKLPDNRDWCVHDLTSEQVSDLKAKGVNIYES